ncbi:cytochrome c biogenesis protein CcsA [Pseudomonas sp. xss_2]|uniref:cytochrome c biogenesis protein CcsA n=1 Tax=Pseudomonas sp. xss_2 TaxID=3367215 RepID=UPI00370BEEB6
MNDRAALRLAYLIFPAATATALLPGAGNILLGIAVVLLLAGAAAVRARAGLWQAATALLCACATAMLLALLSDRFDFRYVWLYSSPGLPLYLKAANVWGGDEGTLVLLAMMFAPLALRHARRSGWEGIAPGVLTAWYAGAALMMGPFSPTPDAWLVSQGSQGMNAHLQKIWMALHAPAILAAYVWAIAPVGSALEALRGKPNDYVATTLRYNRWAWVVMTAGIGFGMIWALGDFTFGQLWHWDPVQTSVFIVWVMLGAVLHGVRHWRSGGAFSRLLPMLSILLAASTALAMAVTRSATLASSHRYIGTTSWLSHLMLGAVLIAVGAVLLVQRRRSPAPPPVQPTPR